MLYHDTVNILPPNILKVNYRTVTKRLQMVTIFYTLFLKELVPQHRCHLEEMNIFIHILYVSRQAVNLKITPFPKGIFSFFHQRRG